MELYNVVKLFYVSCQIFDLSLLHIFLRGNSYQDAHILCHAVFVSPFTIHPIIISFPLFTLWVQSINNNRILTVIYVVILIENNSIKQLKHHDKIE